MVIASSSLSSRLFRVLMFVAVVLTTGSTRAADYLSPSGVVSDAAGKTLYVATETGEKVLAVDVATGKVTGSCRLPGPAGGLCMAPNGGTLYVTTGGVEGALQLVDVRDGKLRISDSIRVGHTPVAPTVSPDGATVYVCNRFNNDVTKVDVKGRKEVGLIPVRREPIAAAINADGTLLFVANHLPAGAADGDYTAAVVSVVDTTAMKTVSEIALPNGSTGLRGVCVSPDGKYVYVTHILARYHLPTTQLERGWMNTNALSIVDVAARKLLNTVLLDDVDLGAANPWGVACSSDGKTLCVSLAGTHEIAVVDRPAMHAKLDKVAKGEKVSEVSRSAEDVPNDLSFLVGMKRRLKLKGNGPRGLCILGGRAYATEYFSDSLGVVELAADAYPRPVSLALGPKQEITEVRQGEIFFNDASLCFQHWQSCASCHPDARADGLNWDLLNDGMGNPKNTKSLLLAHKTPPVMMTGIRDSAETAVRAGIRYIQFAVRPEADARAIDAYLKSLQPVPSPYLEGGKLSRAAKRGEQLYKRAGCADCHSGEYLTDMKKYDVGLGIGSDKGTKFDTPTLVECWRTAPYLYDGRGTTIKAVLTKYNEANRHGATKGLSEQELADLSEYILSL